MWIMLSVLIEHQHNQQHNKPDNEQAAHIATAVRGMTETRMKIMHVILHQQSYT